jgi:uncharacterized protein
LREQNGEKRVFCSNGPNLFPATMMAASRDASNPLKGLQEVRSGGSALPPVHLWNPPFCGDIDMRIARDGTWFYMNSPIGRKPLYVLFSRVLRKDGDKYFLVTPVEKCGIKVDDAPFVAIRMNVTGSGREQQISLETNVDDTVVVNAENRLRFEVEANTDGLKPYVKVRSNLEALVARALFYDLVAIGVTQGEWFGVWSSGVFFPMQRSSEIGVES